LAAKILMALSASIIFSLGVVHLVYTFWGPMLTPRDPALQISMSQISPVIRGISPELEVSIARISRAAVEAELRMSTEPAYLINAFP